MTGIALTYFAIGAVVLWGGLLTTLTISIKKEKALNS